MNGTKNNGKPQGRYKYPSITLLGFLMEEFAQKHLTTNEAKLHALCDRFCCPINHKKISVQCENRNFRINYLQHVLGISNTNLTKLICKLTDNDFVSFFAWEYDHYRWQFKTNSTNWHIKKKHDLAKNSLYLPDYITAGQAKKIITNMEGMVLARIIAFTERGKYKFYFESNSSLGNYFGIGRDRAKKLTTNLERKSLINKITIGKRELYDRIGKEYDENYRFKITDVVRIIYPQMQALEAMKNA